MSELEKLHAELLPNPLKDPITRYRKIVDEAEYYAIVIVNLDLKIISWNLGAEKITGFSRKEALGQSLDIFFTDEDSQFGIFKREVERARAHGCSEDERWHQRKDGSKFWASGIVTQVKNELGIVVGFCKVFKENTIRKNTEDELRKANSELAQFAYRASHDLKEPLRNISSYLTLIQRETSGKFGPEVEEYLAFVLDGAARMRELINMLLALGEADSQITVSHPVELNATFDAAQASLLLSLKNANAVVTRGALPIVNGNSIQLTELFQNLLANSVKFCHKDKPLVIFLDAREKETMWEFRLRDNGIGISEKDLGRIFEPFQRGHGKSQYPGSGLGLSICKKIAEAHGGKVWAEACSDGAILAFSLPKR